jgi:predicted Zn-dependent protease
MRYVRLSLLFAMTMVIAALFPGCLTVGPMRHYNLLTTQDEIAIGKKLSEAIEKQEKILDDPELSAYISGIGQRLVQVCERKDVDYQFKLIDAPNTVNAFALPGGHMYIYTGLLRYCSSEAELAGVMAHEMGHVAAHHHGEALTRAYGPAIFTSLLLGERAGQVVQVANDIVTAPGMLYFSRQDEFVADAKGLDYVLFAGYPPDAMIAFMNKLARHEEQLGPTPIVFQLFSTHPPTQERVARLIEREQMYPAYRLEKCQDNAQRYRETVFKKLSPPTAHPNNVP